MDSFRNLFLRIFFHFSSLFYLNIPLILIAPSSVAFYHFASNPKIWQCAANSLGLSYGIWEIGDSEFLSITFFYPEARWWVQIWWALPVDSACSVWVQSSRDVVILFNLETNLTRSSYFSRIVNTFFLLKKLGHSSPMAFNQKGNKRNRCAVRLDVYMYACVYILKSTPFRIRYRLIFHTIKNFRLFPIPDIRAAVLN